MIIIINVSPKNITYHSLDQIPQTKHHLVQLEVKLAIKILRRYI